MSARAGGDQGELRTRVLRTPVAHHGRVPRPLLPRARPTPSRVGRRTPNRVGRRTPSPSAPRRLRSPGPRTTDARRTPRPHARTRTWGARRMTLLRPMIRRALAEGTLVRATIRRAGARTRAGRHRAHPLASTTPRGNRQATATRRTAPAASMAPGRKAAVLAAGRSISPSSADSVAPRFLRSRTRAAACARSATRSLEFRAASRCAPAR